MIRDREHFHIYENSADFILIETATDLTHATRRINKLAAIRGGNFLLYDVGRARFVASAGVAP